MKIAVLILFKYLNAADSQKLLEVVKQAEYESKIFYKEELYISFSENENLKSYTFEMLYQHIIILLIHFTDISEKENFEISHLSLYSNQILLHMTFDIDESKADSIILLSDHKIRKMSLLQSLF